MYYKILVDGKSCHGEDLKWSLPKKDGEKWIPGKWHEAKGDLETCNRGLHVTTSPFNWYKWGCELYEAEIDSAIYQKDDKILCRKARLIEPVAHPKWWLDAIEFVAHIKDVPFFKPDGKPMESWKLFTGDSWAAARDAAWDTAWAAARAAAWDTAWDAAGAAARAAAWDTAGAAARDTAWAAARAAARAAAWDTAWDASLYVQTHFICAGLPLDEKHKNYAAARWQVWTKGYGLLSDVNGVLYVYAKE